MSRLIAFGCSLTYGHCLPSRDLAWPNQLSRVLGLDCVNMSRVGSSNKQIWHDLINFDFQEDDVVFVLWSYPSRSCVLKNKKESVSIGHWMIEESELSKTFYEQFYTKYDMETQSKLFVSHANLFLAGKKITIYNLCIDSKTYIKYIFYLSFLSFSLSIFLGFLCLYYVFLMFLLCFYYLFSYLFFSFI
jgi:hypothetical protein